MNQKRTTLGRADQKRGAMPSGDPGPAGRKVASGSSLLARAKLGLALAAAGMTSGCLTVQTDVFNDRDRMIVEPPPPPGDCRDDFVLDRVRDKTVGFKVYRVFEDLNEDDDDRAHHVKEKETLWLTTTGFGNDWKFFLRRETQDDAIGEPSQLTELRVSENRITLPGKLIGFGRAKLSCQGVQLEGALFATDDRPAHAIEGLVTRYAGEPGRALPEPGPGVPELELTIFVSGGLEYPQARKSDTGDSRGSAGTIVPKHRSNGNTWHAHN